MAAYLTAAELATRWACSSRQVQRLCARGELVAMRLGTDWRIPLAAVEAYEREHTSEQAETTGAQPAAHLGVSVNSTPITFGVLPAGYVPVFPALWPGHEPQVKQKRLSTAIKRR